MPCQPAQWQFVPEAQHQICTRTTTKLQVLIPPICWKKRKKKKRIVPVHAKKKRRPAGKKHGGAFSQTSVNPTRPSLSIILVSGHSGTSDQSSSDCEIVKTGPRVSAVPKGATSLKSWLGPSQRKLGTKHHAAGTRGHQIPDFQQWKSYLRTEKAPMVGSLVS